MRSASLSLEKGDGSTVGLFDAETRRLDAEKTHGL